MTSNSSPPTQSPGRIRSPLRIWADLSLSIKIILILLVVTLSFMGGIAFLNIQSTDAALTSQVNQNMEAIANLEAQNIGNVLALRVSSMQAFELAPEVQSGIAAQNATYSGGTEAIQAELATLDEQWIAASDDDPLVQERLNSDLARKLTEYIRSIPDFAEAFLTDRYGGLVAASGRTSDYYQADESWWQSAYNDGQGAVFIAPPELDESTGVIGVDIAVPLRDQNNEIVGIARTTLDITLLVNRLAGAELGKTGEAGILVEGGLFKAYQAQASDEPELVAALSRPELAPVGHTEVSLHGHSNLVSYATIASPTGEQFISDLGWKVTIHQQRSEALSAVDEQTRRSVTIALIGAVIVIIVGVGMGQFIAAPIARLTEAVTRFTAGDMTARTQVNTGDEIGVLGTSFNTMAEQVDGLLTGLEARSQELEERTRELEASQSVTFAASERTSPDELLGMVVDLVRDQFDLYHVQVYIVDPQQGEHGAAVLRESTGYAGSQLLQAGHHIPMERTALVTKSIHENQAVLVADTGEDPNFLPNPLLPETRSELVVPLRIGERVLGVLDIQDRVPSRFSESTVGLFQAMSDQVAFLFENNELLERITEQTESLTVFTTQLRAAAAVAEHLSTILDPEQLLHETAELIQSRFGLYHAHIYVLDEGGHHLVVRAGSGEVGRVLRERGHSIPLDREKSLVARAARTHEPVLVADTALESDFMPNPLLPQTRSELAVPLVAGEQVLGVLDMQDDQIGRFGETDVDTFSTLAGQIATSLQNAGLFEEVEASARRTQVRLDVSQALAGVQTEEDVLDVLIQQAGVYPEAQVTIFTIALEADEQTLIVRRDESFNSGIASAFPIGARFPSAQFPMMQYVTSDAPFVSPNLVLDERLDPASRELANQMGSRGVAILPITAGNEWLGIVAATSKEERFFDERKLLLYQTLADQGAAALQAARLRTEIQKREARFHDVVLSTSDWVWEVDAQGRYTYVSDKVAEVLGYTVEEMLGKTPFDLMPPEEAARVGEIFGEIAANKHPIVELENWNVTKDGREVCMLTDGVPLLDSEGNLTGYRGVDKDITERVQAEQALQESEARFRQMVEGSLAGIYRTSLTGEIFQANPAILEILGFDSLEEANEIGLMNLYADPAEWQRMLQVLQAEGLVRGYEVDLRRKDGAIISISLSARLVMDEEGKPAFLEGTIVDITDRKRAEEAIRESEERFRGLFEDSADAVLLLEGGQFVDCNPATVKMLQAASKKQVLNISPSGISPTKQPDGRLSAEKEQELIALALEEGSQRFEWVHLRADGTEFPVEVVLTPIIQRGRQVLHVVWRDITDRKRAEKQIMGLNRLRESLLVPGSLDEKSKLITDGVVEILDADFARIWVINPGDRCDDGCVHAKVTEGPHVCQYRDRCLHLMASSGRYTHTDGEVHRRVPFGCYKIGRIASEEDVKFITNDVTRDPRVHNNEWAKELGLVSFAGYRIMARDGRPIGVLALFSKHVISPVEDALLENIANDSSQMIQAAEIEEERERFTTQLRTAADLAERINAILDPDELLSEVVDQLHDRFDLYHTHVYLLDEEAGELALRAGYGAPGQTMVERGHSIPLNAPKSLVARAAREREVVLENDTRAAPDFMPNPLLPDTRSEAAVPLIAGGKVLGVFDAQDSKPGRFTPSEVDVFSTLAGQIATALQNAALFEEIRRIAE